MANTEVNATAKLKDKNGNLTGEEREVSVYYDFGDDLSDAVEKFGEEAVFAQYKQQATIGLQAILRRHGADANVSDEHLQEVADNWKPGEKRAVRKSPAEKIQDMLKGKSPEEVQEILQQAQEQAAS